MAGTSLFALLDDIATILDDVAILTKVAAKKTAGVLGDDLALNAQQVSGVKPARELPVVWGVAIGSFRNKLILVPSALAIGALLPAIITPLLMIGGAFLCYEGFEKLAHKFLKDERAEKEHHAKHLLAVVDESIDVVAVEKEKIRGAIRTDFILSAEIIAITLGTVATKDFSTQVLVLSGIAVLMTVGVYGFVAAIVKLDDGGLYLLQRQSRFLQGSGKMILRVAPYLMKALSFAGTVAMFLVGGGLLTHGIPGAHEAIHAIAHSAAGVPALGGILETLIPTLLDGITGLLAGAIVLGGVLLAGKLRRKYSKTDKTTVQL